MLDQLTTYLISIIPAAVSVIGIVSAVVASFKNMNKNSTNIIKTVDEKHNKFENSMLLKMDVLAQQNQELLEKCNQVLSENAALKRENRQLKAKIRNVRDSDNEE